MYAVKSSTTSEIELTKNVGDVEYNERSEDVDDTNSKNVIKIVGVKVTAMLSLITVEYYLVCYLMSSVIMSVKFQEFKSEKICRVDLNYTEDICNEIGKNESFQAEINYLKANITAWSDPITKFVPAVLMLSVGAWSDRTGNRKILMLVPIFGDFLKSLLLLMGTFNFTNWSMADISIVETIIGALTGGRPLSMCAVFIYLADVTNPVSLTLKIGISIITMNLFVPLSQILAHVLTNTMNYYELFSLTAVFYVIGFCYVLIRIKDANRAEEEIEFPQKVKIFIHPRNYWHTFSIVFLSKGRRLAQILLIICSYIIYKGPIHGESNLFHEYAINRYHADFSQIRLYYTIVTFAGFFGSSMALMFLSRMLRMHDSILAMIGLSFNILDSLIFGYGTNRYWLYASAMCSITGETTMIAMRSMMGKIGKPENIGKLFAIIFFLNAFIPMVAIPIFKKIYKNTIDTFPEATYTVAAVLLVPNYFLYAALYIIDKKGQKDIRMNPAVNSYENDAMINVTPL